MVGGESFVNAHTLVIAVMAENAGPARWTSTVPAPLVLQSTMWLAVRTCRGPTITPEPVVAAVTIRHTHPHGKLVSLYICRSSFPHTKRGSTSVPRCQSFFFG